MGREALASLLESRETLDALGSTAYRSSDGERGDGGVLVGRDEGRKNGGMQVTAKTSARSERVSSKRIGLGLRTVSAAIALAMAASTLAPDVALAAPKSRFTPARKVGRGFANTILGFLAIPGQMTAQTRERGAATGLPIGFGMGLGWFVASELIGVYEILSCPFEAPPGYKPILEPEFPWEYFED